MKLTPNLIPQTGTMAPVQERARPGGRSHIPYRNSMMTTVLRDSLGGNCCTAMVATISPSADQLPESIATCRFAQRVAQISNQVRQPGWGGVFGPFFWLQGSSSGQTIQ